MSTFENIYLYTGGERPEVCAGQLAQALGGEVVRARDRVIVKRPMVNVPDGWVRGDVVENMYYENPPDPQHLAVMDLYDISFDVWCTPEAERFQRQEAGLVFDAIVGMLRYPVVLTHDGDLLISAWAPALGRTDFQAGTTSYADSEELWRPYADPARLLTRP
ncbi:MAG: hypothetical protein ACRDT6_11645 [Micromonosporaceae bacterium]